MTRLVNVPTACKMTNCSLVSVSIPLKIDLNRDRAVSGLFIGLFIQRVCVEVYYVSLSKPTILYISFEKWGGFLLANRTSSNSRKA